MILSSFGAGRGGSLVGGDRGGSWGGGGRGGQGRGGRVRWRASTHGAFSWVGGPDKKTDFEFFWGREGKVPGRGRQRRELGLQISGSEPDKKNDFEFFWGRERERGVPGRGRQRRELGPGCEVRGSGGGSGGGQGRGDRGKGVEGGVVRSRNAFRGQEPGGSAGHAGARAEGGGCGGGVVKTTSRVRGFPGARPQRRGRRISRRMQPTLTPLMPTGSRLPIPSKVLSTEPCSSVWRYT